MAIKVTYYIIENVCIFPLTILCETLNSNWGFIVDNKYNMVMC